MVSHKPPPTRYGATTAQPKPGTSAARGPMHRPPATSFDPAQTRGGTAQAKPAGATARAMHAPPATRFGPAQTRGGTAQTKPAGTTTRAVHAPPATLFAPAQASGRAVQRMDAKLPFAFRYDNSTDAPMTMSIESSPGGFVSMPVNHQPYWQEEEYEVKQSVAYGISYDDMPTGGKRAVTQGGIMGVSPNVAAQLLKLSKPQYPYWEWLHMIAFSISPTHVDELSEESSDLLEHTNQPQQISENLVLGTAASNTEMLSWETAIKSFAKKHKDLKLQLEAMPLIEKRVADVDGNPVTIPVCVRMKYDFFFYNPETKEATAPFVVEFDTLSHVKPSSKSFEAVKEALKKGIESMTKLKELPEGIRTGWMHGF